MRPNIQAERLIRDIPDFPRAGILFKDVTPILADPAALREVIDALAEDAHAFRPDIIVGIESRGFLFGTPVADRLGLGFVPVRKLGKLPYQTIQEEYALEYGVNTVEIHTDAVLPGQRAVIIDDLMATGGTASAAARLIARAGGVVAGYCFVIELGFLKGRDRLPNGETRSLLMYD